MTRYNLKVKPVNDSPGNERSVRILREMTAQELDQLFQEATADAIEESVAQDVPLSGLDESGRIVQSYNAHSPRLASEKKRVRSSERDSSDSPNSL